VQSPRFSRRLLREKPSGPSRGILLPGNHSGKPASPAVLNLALRMKRPRAKRKRPHQSKGQRPKWAVSVRRVPERDAWELIHPRCVRERAEDIEEVEAMLAAGEDEVARDELRWLLEGCHQFITAHRMLGEIALAENDVKLARGHFGFAYQIGLKAVPAGGLPGPLPYELPANRAFFEAGKGLAWCLRQLGEERAAIEVVETLLRLDPSDPLGLSAWKK